MLNVYLFLAQHIKMEAKQSFQFKLQTIQNLVIRKKYNLFLFLLFSDFFRFNQINLINHKYEIVKVYIKLSNAMN